MQVFICSILKVAHPAPPHRSNEVLLDHPLNACNGDDSGVASVKGYAVAIWSAQVSAVAPLGSRTFMRCWCESI